MIFLLETEQITKPTTRIVVSLVPVSPTVLRARQDGHLFWSELESGRFLVLV